MCGTGLGAANAVLPAITWAVWMLQWCELSGAVCGCVWWQLYWWEWTSL